MQTHTEIKSFASSQVEFEHAEQNEPLEDAKTLQPGGEGASFWKVTKKPHKKEGAGE